MKIKEFVLYGQVHIRIMKKHLKIIGTQLKSGSKIMVGFKTD